MGNMLGSTEFTLSFQFNLHTHGKYEYDKYDSWIQGCLSKRIELNSISSYRLKESLIESKVRDFCDYLITKLEDPNRLWDLNRYKKPYASRPIRATIDFEKPKIIEEIEVNIELNTDSLNEKIEEVRDFSLDMVNENNENSNSDLNEFLEAHDLDQDFEWKSLIENQYNQMEHTSNILYKATKQRSKAKYSFVACFLIFFDGHSFLIVCSINISLKESFSHLASISKCLLLKSWRKPTFL